MGCYHFHLNQLSRGKGQSAIASAAYRAGTKLECTYYGEVSDYTRKGGVVLAEIHLPKQAPERFKDREILWNEVEWIEGNKKAQLAHSFDITLMNEFSMEENIELARRFVEEQLVARGMIADLAIHDPKKAKDKIPNPHMHIMVPIRPLKEDGTWGQKQKKVPVLTPDGQPVLNQKGQLVFRAVHTTDWSRKETLEELRSAWAKMCNELYEEKGLTERVDARYAAMRGTDENRYRGEARGSEKAYGFGHIGTDEKLFVFESPIDLLSYITAVPEEWEKHSYISLGGLSEKAMKRMYTEYPHIHSIYLCLDNDEPGNERCRQFVSLIPEELSVYRLEPVKKDWNECLVAEVPVENMAKQMCWRDAREKPVPVMKMSEVEETVVQWLWYPFIPFGKVTLIQGNPGKGKTWLAMAIAAYCTNGKELPNALPIEPFNVLYQTAEDGIADTIKPRLAKCGADMTRVRFINEDEKQLSMTDDRIEKAIRQNSVRLMIMDPIQAYLGANVDMNRANEIRPLFRHLSTIAERTGCAIVLIGHLNKSSGSQSDYRSLGSIDIAAAVRSILFVEKVEKEKEQDIRVVYQQKDSLAKKENPVAFSLGEEGLKWLGEYDISIEDLLMGKAGTKKETKLEKAQKLILELLTKRKVMCLEELEAELLAYGISSRTGRDARKQLENRLSYDWCQGRKTVALITE